MKANDNLPGNVPGPQGSNVCKMVQHVLLATIFSEKKSIFLTVTFSRFTIAPISLFYIFPILWLMSCIEICSNLNGRPSEPPEPMTKKSNFFTLHFQHSQWSLSPYITVSQFYGPWVSLKICSNLNVRPSEPPNPMVQWHPI